MTQRPDLVYGHTCQRCFRVDWKRSVWHSFGRRIPDIDSEPAYSIIDLILKNIIYEDGRSGSPLDLSSFLPFMVLNSYSISRQSRLHKQALQVGMSRQVH